jgi:hypothetical protein
MLTQPPGASGPLLEGNELPMRRGPGSQT